MRKIIMLVLLLAATPARAHDYGQWENADPVVRQWYKNRMQSDNPRTSCCGSSDAYWCDDIHVRDSKTFCKITDDRPDEPLMRRHIDIGTEIEIPVYKINKDPNLAGHSVIFLSPAGFVYCFVPANGS